MNLYKLTNMVDPVCTYDTFDSIIVAAKSTRAAIRIHPEGHVAWHKTSGWICVNSEGTNYPFFSEGGWPAYLTEVKCEYLGKAGAGIKSGVILTSFNAG